jgi:hypothetical protein
MKFSTDLLLIFEANAISITDAVARCPAPLASKLENRKHATNVDKFQPVSGMLTFEGQMQNSRKIPSFQVESVFQILQLTPIHKKTLPDVTATGLPLHHFLGQNVEINHLAFSPNPAMVPEGLFVAVI